MEQKIEEIEMWKRPFQEKLGFIQAQLKAPKDKPNDYAHFMYRSAESILGNLKPWLQQTKCTVTLMDEPIVVGDRTYIKSSATLTDIAGTSYTVQSVAREPQAAKGKDESQITGGAVSYARKYALCGLFAIDDSSQDPDETNKGDKESVKDKVDKVNHKIDSRVDNLDPSLKRTSKQSQESPKPEEPEAQPKVNAKMIYQLQNLFEETGKKIDESLVLYKVTKLEDLTVKQGKHLYSFLLNWKKNHAQQV